MKEGEDSGQDAFLGKKVEATSQYINEKTTDLLIKLEKLGELKQKGILTEEEFQPLKSQILKELSEEISNTKYSAKTTNAQQQYKQGSVKPEFLIYENTTYGIKIQYPPDWEGTEFNDAYRYSAYRIVEFGLPSEKPSKGYGRCAICIQPLYPWMFINENLFSA